MKDGKYFHQPAKGRGGDGLGLVLLIKSYYRRIVSSEDGGLEGASSLS